jgi:hypothetical protein
MSARRAWPDNEAVRKDRAARMVGLQRAYETSSGAERDRHLLGALVLCGTLDPLPDWVYKALFDLLKDRLPQEPGLHWVRWMAILEAKRSVSIVRGRKRKTTWKAAYAQASERLADTPAAGTARTMKESYALAQREARKWAT